MDTDTYLERKRRPYSIPRYRRRRTPELSRRQKVGAVLSFTGLVLSVHSLLPQCLLEWLLDWEYQNVPVAIAAVGLILCLIGLFTSRSKLLAALGIVAAVIYLSAYSYHRFYGYGWLEELMFSEELDGLQTLRKDFADEIDDI
ncbi:MAG: hypothetical protein GY847_17970 [Proteobacteria bacterium]|nr:hypothetical protein [Pseudomonadota bacterium]